MSMSMSVHLATASSPLVLQLGAFESARIFWNYFPYVGIVARNTIFQGGLLTPRVEFEAASRGALDRIRSIL